jgi:hypothetical protein
MSGVVQPQPKDEKSQMRSAVNGVIIFTLVAIFFIGVSGLLLKAGWNNSVAPVFGVGSLDVARAIWLLLTVRVLSWAVDMNCDMANSTMYVVGK